MFGGKTRLSYDIYLWPFEVHFTKDCGIFCSTAFTPKTAVAILAGISMAGLDSQRVKRML
jgi:hypothetical protein